MFKAVTLAELRQTLGNNCSPSKSAHAGPMSDIEPCYVIGPDVHGTLSHCATCRDMVSAKALADEWSTAARLTPRK